MMETAIIKGKGIDHLVSGYSPKKVEEERIIKADNNTIFQKYIRSFVEDDEYLSNVREVLPPDKINDFLTTLGQQKVKGWECKAGRFISRLIQNSFNAGNESFLLDNPYPEIQNLCRGLQGKDRLHVEIRGHGGWGFAHFSSRCHYNIQCPVNSLGQTEWCESTVNGDIRKMEKSFFCTYRTEDPRIDLQLFSKVHKGQWVSNPLAIMSDFKPSYNRIIFINDQDEERTTVFDHNY